MEVRATAICYNRYCGSTLQKRSLIFNIKKEPLHAHSINSAGKYSAHVVESIFFFQVLLHYRFGQLTSLPNHRNHYGLPLQNER